MEARLDLMGPSFVFMSSPFSKADTINFIYQSTFSFLSLCSCSRLIRSLHTCCQNVVKLSTFPPKNLHHLLMWTWRRRYINLIRSSPPSQNLVFRSRLDRNSRLFTIISTVQWDIPVKVKQWVLSNKTSFRSISLHFLLRVLVIVSTDNPKRKSPLEERKKYEMRDGVCINTKLCICIILIS